MQAARQIQAQRTYFTGFAHRATHDAWLHLATALAAGRTHAAPATTPTTASQGTIKAAQFERGERVFADDDDEAFTASALEEMAAWPGAEGGPMWARPAYDGLRVVLQDGHVRDHGDASPR
jgi:hypothetical protein